MAKNIKIFIVTGVFLDLEDNNSVINELSVIVGYFTNLKELYENFKAESIQSYSTICAHISKQGYYMSKSAQFWHRKDYEKFDEIIIRKVVANQLYQAQKYVSLSQLLTKEVSSIDVHLGMSLSRADSFNVS